MSKEKNLEDMLYEWDDKLIEDLSFNELSKLEYILDCLPFGVDYTIKTKEGKEYDSISDYRSDRTEEYFEATEEDYKKLIGKCFINDDKDIVVKVVGIRDDYDSKYYESDHHVDNFLYEK